MNKCTNRNNIHRLAEIKEESLNTIQNTIQNSLENTQVNFKQGFQLRRRIKSHNAGSNDIHAEVVQQRQDEFNEDDDPSKYVEIAIPNQNGLIKRTSRRQKQKMIYDQVKKTIIKNIYCSNQQEQFFKSYIQQQNAPVQQQQQIQFNVNSPTQMQINNFQERQSSQSSYQQSVSTSASTSYNSYNPKKQQIQNCVNVPNMQNQYVKQLDQSQNQNNMQFLKGVTPAGNRNSPGTSAINTQTLIKYIQNDNPEQLEMPKRIERKIQYIERFSSATVYMGKGSNSSKANNQMKQGYLPPVKNQINKSIDKIDTLQGYTQPDIQYTQQGSFSSQNNLNENFPNTQGRQYERSISNERQGNSNNLIRLEKALIDYKEDELSQHINQQQQKQKSIIQKQQQQLDQYRQLQQQSQQPEKEDYAQSTTWQKTTDNINPSYNLIKLNRIEQLPQPQTFDCNQSNQKETEYNALTKKQFENFMKDKQKLIDERINSLKVTDIDKVRELKNLLEKQKGNIDQDTTSFSFSAQQDKKYNVQRAHSQNVDYRSPKNSDLNNSNRNNINQNSLNYQTNNYKTNSNNKCQTNRQSQTRQSSQMNGSYKQNIDISQSNICFDNQNKEQNKRQNKFENNQYVSLNSSIAKNISNLNNTNQNTSYNVKNIGNKRQSVSLNYQESDLSKQNSYISYQNSYVSNQNSYLNLSKQG